MSEIIGRIVSYRIFKKCSIAIIKKADSSTIQAIIPKELEYIYQNPTETIYTFLGPIVKTVTQVKSTTIKDQEIQVQEAIIYSKSNELPFLVKDVPDHVDIDLCKKYPYLAHRSSYYQNIMKTKSNMLRYVREYLWSRDFTEFQTPKLIKGASESGSDVFKLKYFDQDASLAQSPQLYKQMVINSDYNKMFEIGPVFRAENSNTNRHLTEFTGLDIEMVITDISQVYREAWNMLYYVFAKLGYAIPFHPIVINYQEAATLLKDFNVTQDISTENEKELGRLVKEIYNTDIFILYGYPTKVRPFYTKNDGEFSRSFDIIFKGVEICSGAERETVMKCVEGLEDYLESFKYGSYRHGGCGFGVERLLACYMDLPSVHLASFCPRTPSILTP